MKDTKSWSMYVRHVLKPSKRKGQESVRLILHKIGFTVVCNSDIATLRITLHYSNLPNVTLCRLLIYLPSAFYGKDTAYNVTPNNGPPTLFYVRVFLAQHSPP